MKKLVLVVAMFMFVCGGTFLVKAKNSEKAATAQSEAVSYTHLQLLCFRKQFLLQVIKPVFVIRLTHLIDFFHVFLRQVIDVYKRQSISISLRAVTAITGIVFACGILEARKSFTKSKPLIAGICISVSNTSRCV